MAHITIVTAGYTGLFNAVLALVKQIQPAGHQITYVSPQDLRTSLVGTGISFVQLEPWALPKEPMPSGSWWQKLRHLRDRQQSTLGSFHTDAFVETLRSLSPDLVLIDIEMHPHIIAAVRANFSVALLCPFISIWNRAGLPPIHTATIPGEGWRGEWWGMQWSWLRYGWGKWRSHQRDRLRTVGLDYPSLLHRLAYQLGYRYHNNRGFSQWLVPYPHSQLPILCLHPLEMDFPHQPPAGLRYMGPMVYQPSAEALETEPSSALKAFLTQRTGQALIYCGCSSFSVASRRFLAQIEAIAQLAPHWDFVVGLGSKTNNVAADNNLSVPNLCVLPWAPQHLLLQQADCAIINGGAHTITECVAAGVPMLVCPLARDDQQGNAARVVYHGLGERATLQAASAERLQQMLEKLLLDDSYRDRIAAMQAVFDRYRATNVAAQHIEQLLDKSVASEMSVRSPLTVPASAEKEAVS